MQISDVRRNAGRYGLLTLLFSLLLAGCQREPPTDLTQPYQGASLNTAGVLEYPASDYIEQTKGTPGGTLRVSVAADVGTFNIHAVSHGNVQWLGRLVFDTLFYQDDKGNISPYLVKRWDISEDRRTYTFHLRDDVTFSDGTAFNAEAVRINLEHMRDAKTRSPLAGPYIRPYSHGEVVDEYTFRAHLKEPYTPFLDVLAQSWLGMISPRQILDDPQSIIERPIGSGPFVLDRYKRDQYAHFKRRENYQWAPTLIGHTGPAYLERLELTFIPEALVRYASLLAGQYDLTLDAPPQNAQAIRANPQLVFHSRIRKANPFRSVTFNTTRPPFDDVRIRKAVALAIDREGIARVTGFGELQPKADFLAVNTRYYDPRYSQRLPYDVAEAERILDAAGWAARDAEGFRINASGERLASTLQAYPALPPALLVAIQSDLKKIGFDLRIEMLQITQLAPRREDNSLSMTAGGYWHTNTPDGLYMLYHTASIPSSNGQNSSRISDLELDQLLEQARRSADPEELQRLYSRAQERLTELVPAVPSYESQHLSAHGRQVKGLLFDTSHNTPVFTTVWLEKP